MTGPETMTPFEERLLSQLQEYRERLPELPPPAPAAEQWIVPTRRLVVAGALIAVLAAAGGAAIVVSRSHSKAAGPRTVTQVKQRMLEALSDSDGRILHQVVTGSGSGHSEGWQDLQTGKTALIQYAADGRRVSALFSSETGGIFRVDVVDYPGRTWDTVATHHASNAQGGGTQQLEDLYRSLVTRGVFRLAGTATIDGVAVIDLREKLPAPPGLAIAPSTVDLWVDSSTYLPVRQTISRDSAIVSTTDYSLLPRSEANLEKLDLIVPTGFTHNRGTGASSSGTFSSGTARIGGTQPMTVHHPAAAIAPSGDRIVHWTTLRLGSEPGGSSSIRRADIWSDMATGTVRELDYDPDGKVVRESASSVSGSTVRVETVDYTARTWQTDVRVYPDRAVMPTGIAVGAAPSPDGMSSIGAPNRFSFTRNGATPVDKETIDGVPAVHYRQQVPSATGTVTEDVWFDASTYVPLRAVTTQGSKVVSRETWQWLTPTAAERAKTTFVAPHGFTHTTAQSNR